MDRTKVWLVESGDYEQRGVDFVATGVEAAVAGIKARYPEPYIVRWDDVEEVGEPFPGEWTITGHFESVVHYSTRHDCTFSIAPWDVFDGNGTPTDHDADDED